MVRWVHCIAGIYATVDTIRRCSQSIACRVHRVARFCLECGAGISRNDPRPLHHGHRGDHCGQALALRLRMSGLACRHSERLLRLSVPRRKRGEAKAMRKGLVLHACATATWWPSVVLDDESACPLTKWCLGPALADATTIL